MEPLGILSVVAAVVQFVDFGQRLLSETWKIYRSASGQSLALQELSAISEDLSQLSAAIKRGLHEQEVGSFGSAGGQIDGQLVRLCGECDALEAEIQQLLLKLGAGFQKEIEQDRRAAARAQSRKYVPRPVGVCFREALRGWWSFKDIDALASRLGDLHQKVMKVATVCMWDKSRHTADWEQQFSNKIDVVIDMLSRTLYTDMRPGPEHIQNQAPEPVERTVMLSLRQNNVTQEIIGRLWSPEWQPDQTILSSFPDRTDVSSRDLSSVIARGLRFESMENREKAIVATFDCTFEWVFRRQPPSSPENSMPMWSSFPNWLGSDVSYPYWITGKPGSGKSTMMKFVANHPSLKSYLGRWVRQFPLYQMKYYAWKPGRELAKSVDGLLRAILYQLITMNPDLAPVLCPRRWTVFHTTRELDESLVPKWTSWELEESFERLLRLSETSFRAILFVDGLDEFDTAPVELSALMQRIASHVNIKVCVASRPWPQFSDSFARSPGLQMHLLTEMDILAFVNGYFKDTPAFKELDDLYHGRGQELLNQIVSKARGVFLWTALVTRTLLESLIDGAGLQELQQILDSLPAEIEDLYDAIYLTIPPRLLPSVSAILQIYMQAVHPVGWRTLWLADEMRQDGGSIQARDLKDGDIEISLRRRLGARTRGILELVAHSGTVEYLHRTAEEWIVQPRVWEQLRSASPLGFDPNFCLLRAETLLAEVPLFERHFSSGISDLWSAVSRTLYYASAIDESVTSDAALADILDKFDETCMERFSIFIWLGTRSHLPWPSFESMQKNVRENSFHGLATQFGVLSYVRYKWNACPERFHCVSANDAEPLLSQAVFGPEKYTPDSQVTLGNPFSVRRLAVVEFLLARGVRQSGVWGKVKDELSGSKDPTQIWYFQEVLMMLEQHDRGESNSVKTLFGVRMSKIKENWPPRFSRAWGL